MWSSNFYYVIVGGGLAGLQLALEFSRDLFFKGKSIAIIDPNLNNQGDKTWCFWEKGAGKWDDIVTKNWEKAKFISSTTNKTLELSPYTYKMIRSVDFYTKVKKELEATGDFHFIEDEITTIDPVRMIAEGRKRGYTATHFFDSRISSEYLEDPKSSKIFQHFKGWVIETEKPQFDRSVFTMMDYRLKFKESTSFTYVLPLSENKALVEFTFFTPFLTEEAVYDEYLKNYIEHILKIENYKITESEMGVIPMTDYPFHSESIPEITKIGTGGSWVKGSTGYSFKHTEKKVAQIIENIHAGKAPSKDLIKNRFGWYDGIFLDVLKENNDLGEDIFSKFYTKNTPQEIFKYLDEETSLSEEIKIMISLFHPVFIKSFFRKTF
ncbi:lycopene cyclase family protein [Gillisia limnaea]|uniref:Lycopene beta and epsilon cyclase n=1 Tax=Gillisia limnaea (strain DSM 15749 / LMG 21470 / R-8282) TaxID=865937 RepID=H2C067_GILLR|nr:lycopene cyclase family protein [Gillisia limnaea]EHQ03483.1 Lycopene beta and epsilon cyclase [Gillisia limnaea DSM 15749]